MKFKEFLDVSDYSENTKKMYLIYHKKIYDSRPLTQEKINSLCSQYRNNVFKAVLRLYLFEFLKTNEFEIPRIRGRKKRRLIKFLNRDDINLLINNANTLELKLIIRIGFESGMRISEILSLTPTIMKSRKIIGKGGVEGYFYLTDKTYNILKKYIKNHNIEEEERIFKFTRFGVNTKLARLSKKILGRRISPHWLRHSCAIYLRQQGMDLMQIKEFLRHRDISMTAVYATATNEEVKEKWKEIMET